MELMGFFADFNSGGMLLLFMIFIVFVFFMKKITKVLMNALWIALISAIFPVFANKILGFDIVLSMPTEIYFITLGLGLYVLYLFGTVVYKSLGFFEKIGRAMYGSIKQQTSPKIEKLEKKIDAHMEKLEDKKKKK
ncbi:MAG: hypothetical protein V1802_01360 [Candidatus Aenigmatarchaeota archaeon]